MSERYSFGWSDPRAMFGTVNNNVFKRYGMDYGVHTLGKLFFRKMKVDTHKYETEAAELPIETCRDMWLVKYGNEPVTMEEVANQDALIWEIGNRLYWAQLLESDEQGQTYICR